MACIGNEPKEPVGKLLTKVCKAAEPPLPSAAAVSRLNPMFMAALVIRTLMRVMFISSMVAVAVVAVLDVC